MRLVELGPGRGTLMADALRAAKACRHFRNAVAVHLVEISPALREASARGARRTGVPIEWHDARRGARWPRDLHRQRVLRCAAGAPGGDVRRRLARARRQIGDDGTLHSAHAAIRSRCSSRCCRTRCATRRSARFSNGAPIRSRSSSAAVSSARRRGAGDRLRPYRKRAGDTFQAVRAHALPTR